MKKIKILVPFISVILIACSDSTSPEKQSNPVVHRAEPEIYSGNNSLSNQPVDSKFMKTGFYFLTDKQEGVKMRMEHSNKIYTVSPLPFASVKNIIKAELVKIQLKDGIYTKLCLTMDKKGTSDLKEGTGNFLHPEMAVVIANRLLYVVENKESIKTGVMCIFLIDYTEDEMKAMYDAVENKR